MAKKKTHLKRRKAAEYLGIHYWSLCRLVYEGKIPETLDEYGHHIIEITDLELYRAAVDNRKRR